jgi:hypothetical protein
MILVQLQQHLCLLLVFQDRWLCLVRLINKYTSIVFTYRVINSKDVLLEDTELLRVNKGAEFIKKVKEVLLRRICDDLDMLNELM